MKLLKAVACQVRKLSLFFSFFALTVVSANSVADDTEIYSRLNNNPQMLFLLDVSGSMDQRDNGFAGTRIGRLKDALSTLLASLSGVDVGLMSYTSRGINLLHPVGDVTDNQAALQNIVRSLVAGGGTPSVEALYEGSRYFQGAAPIFGGLPNGASNYTSPIVNECQSSHMVLLTDGVPTGNSGTVDRLNPIYGPCRGGRGSGGTCGVELTGSLADNDQLNWMGGVNNITTHSIGFNINSNWVKDLAAAGGGLYRDASSTDQLLAAFRSILDSATLAATAAAPTISVNAFNESRHRDELYYSFYQPQSSPRWQGNVKKYRLLNGQIVDRDDAPVITAAGIVDEDSRSFWSDTNDGKQVSDGGFAAKQPQSRNWFTDSGAANFTGDITRRKINNNADLTLAEIGAGSAAERASIVGFVRGSDVVDQDFDSITNEPNHFVADSLHNTPVLVSYWARDADDLSNEVIYSANNMGVLHAVDAATGEELWSYTPRELLPNIKKYVDNNEADHVYGLDGNMVLHSTRKVSSAYDYEIDEAFLYLTQRRGGRGIFALDVSNGHNTTDPFDVMWKIDGATSPGFRDLGQTWATPQLIPIKLGCPDNCEVKDVLMFGGGYNPIYDDTALTYPVTAAANGHGNAVYMVDPETGELIWSVGKGTHHTLDLPINDSVPETPVPVDSDADGVVDILFFSDIAGHVWRIDLEQNATDAGDLAISGGLIASLAPVVGGVKQPLRFYNRIDVVINGNTYSTASFNLVLGSGMRASPLFVEPVLNRVYSIRDPWVFTNPIGDELDASGNPVPEYRYVKDSTNNTRDIITTDVLTEPSPSTTARNHNEYFGFYKVLSARAEKILQSSLTHAGRIFLTSYVPPDPSVTSNGCEFQLGESRLQIIDLDYGADLLPGSLRPYVRVGSGITPNGTIVDTGQGNGPDFVTGINSEKLVDLLEPDNPNIFRRFFRTGWTELDE